MESNYSSSGYPVESTSTEVPFTEPDEPAENIDQGRVEPQPTVEERKFSAPYMDWDATR